MVRLIPHGDTPDRSCGFESRCHVHDVACRERRARRRIDVHDGEPCADADANLKLEIGISRIEHIDAFEHA